MYEDSKNDANYRDESLDATIINLIDHIKMLISYPNVVEKFFQSQKDNQMPKNFKYEFVMELDEFKLKMMDDKLESIKKAQQPVPQIQQTNNLVMQENDADLNSSKIEEEPIQEIPTKAEAEISLNKKEDIVNVKTNKSKRLLGDNKRPKMAPESATTGISDVNKSNEDNLLGKRKSIVLNIKETNLIKSTNEAIDPNLGNIDKKNGAKIERVSSSPYKSKKIKNQISMLKATNTDDQSQKTAGPKIPNENKIVQKPSSKIVPDGRSGDQSILQKRKLKKSHYKNQNHDITDEDLPPQNPNLKEDKKDINKRKQEAPIEPKSFDSLFEDNLAETLGGKQKEEILNKNKGLLIHNNSLEKSNKNSDKQEILSKNPNNNTKSFSTNKSNKDNTSLLNKSINTTGSRGEKTTSANNISNSKRHNQGKKSTSNKAGAENNKTKEDLVTKYRDMSVVNSNTMSNINKEVIEQVNTSFQNNEFDQLTTKQHSTDRLKSQNRIIQAGADVNLLNNSSDMIKTGHGPKNPKRYENSAKPIFRKDEKRDNLYSVDIGISKLTFASAGSLNEPEYPSGDVMPILYSTWDMRAFQAFSKSNQSTLAMSATKCYQEFSLENQFMLNINPKKFAFDPKLSQKPPKSPNADTIIAGWIKASSKSEEHQLKQFHGYLK